MKRVMHIIRRLPLYGVVAMFCFFSASPFLWMLITMFKQDRDLYRPANNPFIFNLPPTLIHLDLLFNRSNFMVFLRNSVFIGVVVVVITLLISIPAAYSLARMVGSWGERAGIGIFLVYLVPPTLLFIPLSRVVVAFGLYNSLWALILVYPTITIPFSTWLLMGFIKSIPRDLEEAARVDGYSRVQSFIKVILPLMVSGVIAVIAFTFTLTLVALPIGFVYNIFLDRLVAGFTMGAVKG
jgi:multiple sugar transport system permease protein